MEPLTLEEALFFTEREDALPLYRRLRGEILREIENVSIEVKKTQISFRTKYLFGAVSFTPVRKAAQRPPVWLTVTFGLPQRAVSPRIDAASEPHPRRWTHHVMIGSEEEIDAELLGWLREAAVFAAGKR